MSENSKQDGGILTTLRSLFSRSGDYKRRYGKSYGSNSVDFRKNRRRLTRGQTPEKMNKFAAIIPGDSVVDVGAGEGIVALILAATKSKTRAIDVTPRRHRSGLALKEQWASLGRKVDNCEMLLGDAVSDPSLLDGFDTLVASRVVYYFGDRVDSFIAEAAKRVTYICLVGNASRNRRYARGIAPADVGDNVIYSTPQGMKDLLDRHGFDIVETADFGDPIVIGKRRSE